MPQVIETNLKNENFVGSGSRYKDSKIIYWGDLKLITFETYKRKKYVPTDGDRFYTVTSGTEYRPDLVSHRIYGDVSFWWKIMEINDIKDIWDFKAGTNIVLPGSI